MTKVAVIVHAAAVDVAVGNVCADEVDAEVFDFAVVEFVNQGAGAEAGWVVRLDVFIDGFEGDAFVKDVINQQDVFACDVAAWAHFPLQFFTTDVVAVARGVEVVHAVKEAQAGEELSCGNESAVHHDHDDRV